MGAAAWAGEEEREHTAAAVLRVSVRVRDVNESGSVQREVQKNIIQIFFLSLGTSAFPVFQL